MTVQNELFFRAAMVLLLVVGYVVVDRSVFLIRAERTIGDVTRVWGSSGRCGSRRNRHNCTKYQAAVQFSAGTSRQSLTVSAGTARGRGRPITEARYRVGHRIPVVFNPRRPTRAYRYSFWDIWRAPVALFVFQLSLLAASFREDRTPAPPPSPATEFGRVLKGR